MEYIPMSEQEVANNFDNILDDLVRNNDKKIGILRNNKLEVIMMSATEYEKWTKMIEDIEAFTF